MQHPNGKVTCDREIGSPVKGWHSCNDRATYEVVKQCGPKSDGIIALHYCHAHLEAGQRCDLPSIRLVSVRPLYDTSSKAA